MFVLSGSLRVSSYSFVSAFPARVCPNVIAVTHLALAQETIHVRKTSHMVAELQCWETFQCHVR